MRWEKSVRLAEQEAANAPKDREVVLPALIASAWNEQQLAAPKLGRKEADIRSRIWLSLTDRRFSVLKLGIYPVHEIQLEDVLSVEVLPAPGRKIMASKLMQKLYRVQVVRIHYRDAMGSVSVLDYDAYAETEPFAAKLREYVVARKGKATQG